jgi:thiol-disulfide isomerase/thioredoxin
MAMKKNLILIIVLALIVGTIFYINSKLAHPAAGNTPVVTVTAPALTTATSSPDLRAGFLTLAQKAAKYSLAKEISDPTGFINTPDGQPIKLSDYIGNKVVLIDFWTYSCINCQRTVPYLEAWYEKYKDEGLVVIGIHTPEFEFEKDYDNVAAAVKRLGITYPVVMDSNYGTWNAYQNQYWPHKYLIDIDGYVTYDAIGEGDYDKDEEAIQNALKERAQVLGTGQTISGGLVTPAGVGDIEAGSPETYFGSNRNEYLANGEQSVAGNQTLTLPTSLQTNALYLGGTWDFFGEYAQSISPTSEIEYQYNAKNIYFVAGATTPVTVDIFQDGVKQGSITVKDAKLYTLVQNLTAGTHTIDLKVENAGLQAFTFTFG